MRSDRIPKWLLPVIRENLAAGRDVRLAAAVVASWARYAEGVDEQGEPITVVDRLADSLTAIAQTQRSDPLAFVANRELFGDLVDDPGFPSPTWPPWRVCTRHGARATLGVPGRLVRPLTTTEERVKARAVSCRRDSLGR